MLHLREPLKLVWPQNSERMTPVNWQETTDAVLILRKAKEIVMAMQTQNSPTRSSILPMLIVFTNDITMNINSGSLISALGKEFATALLTSFRQHEEQLPSNTLVCTALDRRYNSLLCTITCSFL